MEISYKEFINNCLTSVAHDQLAVTCSVDAKDRGGIKRLLGVSAECKVLNAEPMKGEARISGKTAYKVIYIDRDNKTCGLDYFCDFSESISGEMVPTDRLNISASVVDVSGKLHDDTVTLTAVCDFNITVIGKNEGKSVNDAENIFLRREDFECVELTDLKENTFEVSHEEESGTAVEKVLYFNTIPLITSVNKSDVGATVEGFVQANIVYLGANGVQGKSLEIPFSEEIEADSLADVNAVVKNSRLVLSGDRENNIFEIEAFVTLSGYDVGVKDEQLVTDAFSLTNELTVEKEYLPCKRYVKCESLDFAVSTEAESEELPENAQVLASPVLRVNIANVLPGENEITVEGLAVATVLYSVDERVDSVQVELPFSVTQSVNDITPDDSLTAEALITDLTVDFMSGILRLRAMLKARVCVYKTYTLRWISSIKTEDLKTPNSNGISIYYTTAGDDLWDIAKAVNISPDELLISNPDLSEPSPDQRRVVVFRSRKD